MKNIKIISNILALSFIAVSCSGNHKLSTDDNMAPVAVKVSNFQTDNPNPFVSASGKIKATNSANLSTRMMGYVNKIYIKVGDEVRKGQLLISINNAGLVAKRAQINANITKAAAAYNIAEKDYNRFKKLYSENSTSQKEMDDITAHYEMAKAVLEAANQMKNEIDAQFAYVDIRSPFNGIVTNKFIEVGDMANPGVPLIAVESPNSFEVTAMVPESNISQIKSGAKVDVHVKSMHRMIQGQVTEISTSAKNTGGQYLVKIGLDKTDDRILSGMFVTVQFPVDKNENTTSNVMVPSSAIIKNGGLKGVYTVSEQNTALLRWLRLGKTYGDRVEVLSGLNTEEKYIISADAKLFNGAKVTIQ